MPLWARLPLAVAAGAVFALGQAPYDLWPLALLGLVAVFVLVRRLRSGWGAIGWSFGVGYFGLGMAWIVEPFQVDAAATGWMAPFALFGIAAGLSLFWMAAFRGAALAGRYWALVPFWALAELARAYVLTGFPWAHVGYLWAPSPAIQWVSVVGPHGLGLATLTLAALAGAALAERRMPLGAGACLLGALLLLGGLWLTPPLQDPAGRPVVRLVQPNAPQQEKWDPARAQMFFERQVSYTAAEPAPALVVWPETSLPMLLSNAGPAIEVISQAAGPDTRVVLGAQREQDGAYFNSLVVIGPDGKVTHVYDKHHLVPFGEYMPLAGLFARFNILGLAARADGGFSAGPGPELVSLGALGRALPLICYEAVFPQDVNSAPERPDMLLQITNDAWFGDWSGPYQHLSQARIRAIEQGLPVVRAANTGVSAVIDGGGRLLGALPLGQAGYLDLPLPSALAPTPYSRMGDLPVAILLALLAGIAVLRTGRNSD